MAVKLTAKRKSTCCNKLFNFIFPSLLLAIVVIIVMGNKTAIVYEFEGVPCELRTISNIKKKPAIRL